MESWVSNFFCCNSKNDVLEPTYLSQTSMTENLQSCSCSTSTLTMECSEVTPTVSLTENLELRECKPKSSIKITILPLASDPKTSSPSLEPKHLHYSTVLYDTEKTSQTEDFSQNYGDAIISSRPSFTFKQSSSFSSVSSHEDMDLLDQLQKARYNSNRQLPPLPKSPGRKYYTNTTSYNCKTFL